MAKKSTGMYVAQTWLPHSGWTGGNVESRAEALERAAAIRYRYRNYPGKWKVRVRKVSQHNPPRPPLNRWMKSTGVRVRRVGKRLVVDVRRLVRRESPRRKV